MLCLNLRLWIITLCEPAFCLIYAIESSHQ